jgi:hypothetical protein
MRTFLSTVTDVTNRSGSSLALLIACMLLVSGCDGFLDVNENPNVATEPPVNPVFTTAVVNMGSERPIELVQTPILAQRWASSGVAGVFNSPAQYTISTFTTGNTYGFWYTDIAQNLQLITNQADETQTNAVLQAQVFQAFAYYDLTRLFGAIPFQQANSEAFDEPEFDNQEQVLRGIVSQVDSALMVGGVDDGEGAVTNGALIYNGDIAKWERFGNSLKLASLMLLRSGGAGVDDQIRDLIENADLIESPEDNALIPYGTTANNQNPRFQLIQDFPVPGPSNGYFVGGEPLVDVMNRLGDPRRSAYLDTTSAGNYAGSPPGAFEFGASAISNNIIRAEYPCRLMTAGQVLLYQAEFLASQGELDAANEKYEQGIRASIDFFDGRPGEIPEGEEDAYIDALPSLSSVSQAEAVRDVHEQLYIAIFERSIDSWTVQRRTGVPELDVPQGAALGDIIQRFPYPPDVKSANENVPDPTPLTEPLYFAQ